MYMYMYMCHMYTTVYYTYMYMYMCHMYTTVYYTYMYMYMWLPANCKTVSAALECNHVLINLTRRIAMVTNLVSDPDPTD